MTKEKLVPRVDKLDEKGEFPWEIWEILRENGLLGLSLPEEYGGGGQSLRTYCLVAEQLATYCYSITFFFNDVTIDPLVIGGSEEQKRRFLPKVAKGEISSSIAITEPGAGSDVGAIKTHAVLKENKYVLNGTKCFISFADTSDIILVLAKTDPAKKTKGMNFFIVEKGTPGMSIGKIERKMGVNALHACEIIFDDCSIPKKILLGNQAMVFLLPWRLLMRLVL